LKKLNLNLKFQLIYDPLIPQTPNIVIQKHSYTNSCFKPIKFEAMIHFETQWQSQDGTAIFAQGWQPDAPEIKAVVCLVHGLGEHSGRYAHVAEAFCKAGMVLFTADTRGHGRSGGIRGHFPSLEAVLQDIDLLLAQARQRYPGLPLLLYGHSLGGILVLHYALKRKPDLLGVIATSPGLRTALEQQPFKIAMAKLLGTLIPKATLPSGLDVNALSHDQSVIDTYKNDPLNHDKVSLGFGKIMLGVAAQTLQHAAEFPLPLLLIHGKADAIAFASGSIEFAEAMADNVRLVLVEGGFHELHNEPGKDEMIAMMLEWAGGVVSA
jgi:alpha-beta hydrolase superfamily lysophospholipase